MATLVSPGVSVSVTDESFYASSGPGTVPLIILATEQNKLNSAGDAIATGTIKSEAGKLNLVSSQRELLQLYGTPNFNEIGGNALHGNPLNEYGLLAAHSYLGIANRAYTLRADIDLAQLQPTDNPPSAPPKDGTYWMDTESCDYGLYQFDGEQWVKQTPEVVESLDQVSASSQFAVIAGRVVDDLSGDFISENTYYVRNGSTLEVIDSNLTSIDVQYSKIYPTKRSDATALEGSDLWINLSEAAFSTQMYDDSVGVFMNKYAPFYGSPDEATADYGSELAYGDLFVQYNYMSDTTAFQHSICRYNGKSEVTVASTAVAPFVPTAFTVIAGGIEIPVQVPVGTLDEALSSLKTAFSTFPSTGLDATTDGTTLYIINRHGTSITIADGSTIGFDDGVYSNWEPLVYEASAETPEGDIDDGTLWISTEYKIDILRNTIGAETTWESVSNIYTQSSEPDSASVNDLWVDTDDLENYPAIREYTADGSWRLVNNTDQSTPNGVIFADASAEPSSGTPGNGLDLDAPDPLAYPEGMLLWNSRYSTKNVKEWRTDYTFEGEVVGDRWVSASGNDIEGAIVTGEAAVKKMVVEALQAVIASNDDIRAESVFYNLITAPGYVELIDEMVTLNIDRKETAFVIGDTPFDLQSSGTALQAWATNSNNAASNGDNGLLSADEYLGVYYPSGLSTNIDGNEVVVPPSHMLLRTIAYNDNVAYQWFAPAGLNRGGVSNATSVGYISDEGEFVPVELNSGQCDILYSNNINPIKFIPNRGLNVWGQKTRSPVQSAMDRVNVARLLNYIRYQCDQLAQPFLFEPNDAITRGNVKTAFDSLMGNLVVLRGLYDFIVVCDESNNTSDRIDRNELWIDIAIQPVKAIEFVYIPIRIKNTGSSLT